MVERLNFGFLPVEKSYSGGGLVVDPLPDFRERIGAVWSSGRVDGFWLYPPLCEEEGLQEFGPVTVQAKVYIVPETHSLSLINGDSMPYELCDLAISIIGFFKGLRLIPEGWNHFYRTPVSIGTLVDFSFDDAQMGMAMEGIVAFYRDESKSQMAKIMFGALHWFLTSQSYEHEFELFSAQYIVLDTCWRIFRHMKRCKDVKHAERPIVMCESLGICAPTWAVPSNGSSPLSTLRNELLHEGQYASGPIGFDFSERHPDINIELRNLNSRLLLALLGFKTAYIQAPVNRRLFRLVLD